MTLSLNLKFVFDDDKLLPIAKTSLGEDLVTNHNINHVFTSLRNRVKWYLPILC